MKRLVSSGVVASALIGPALAADMPAQYLPSPDVPPVVVWAWTGPYIGINGGSAISFTNTVVNTATDTGISGLGADLRAGKIPASVGLTHSGFIGGAQIGYNWQLNPSWTSGIEFDFDGDGGGSNSTTSVFPGGHGVPGLSTTFDRQLNTVGTLRGRAGYVMAPDQLWYVTAGAAFGGVKVGSAFTCSNCKPPSVAETSTINETSRTQTGWTIGAGIEWKFAPTWSLKTEYLYVDLGNGSNTILYNYGKNVSTLARISHTIAA
jgi:outer membrane immunogenic protein